MKILKFGGTSLGSAASIEQLVSIVEKEIRNSQANPVVVLSAMSGVTNTLTEMAEMAANDEDYSLLITELESKHFSVVRALLPTKAQNPVLSKLKICFNELEDTLQAVAQLGELSLQTKDKILSLGEICSTFMVSHIASQKIPETNYVNGSKYIKTDAAFGSAKVDFELTQDLIHDFYQSNTDKVHFVTGFISSKTGGQITTLGRGGSDYTAAVWGAALDAEEIQIWTDVNGMMTADPRMVKKAFSLNELSYTEAMELSYFGAKVIYPPTMTQAFLKNIPILIKNTFQPEFKGTLIKNNIEVSNLPIKGISTIEDISIINLTGSGMVGKTGFSGRLFSLLSREQINVVLITQSSSEHSISFAVKPSDSVFAIELIKREFELEIEAKKLRCPEAENHLSVMAIVGENIKNTPGMSGRLFNALGRNGVNVRAIAQGSSEYNISVIIAKKDLSKAVNTVHDAFFIDLKRTLNIFCLGTGNIGKTLFQQLKEQSPFLATNNDLQVRVTGISNTRKMLFDAEGISLENWEEKLKDDGKPADLSSFVSKMKTMNLSNCVFVDNTASEDPICFYQGIFESSISVVTCNKKGNSAAFSQYDIFKNTAKKHEVDFYYETNVGAGLPIIRVLRELMMSGDKIKRIEAILSGSISYIFNNFKGDRDFSEIVSEAQKLGFTEPDPREDLNGKDFMRKMLILARESGHTLEDTEIKIENILPDPCLNASSVEEFYAELKANASYFEKLKSEATASGKVLRYIGILEDGKVEISLQMVDEKHAFYMLSGSDNIISFTTDRYKNNPMVIKGPGAGAEVTAAGVFADIINVGTN